MDDQRPTHAPQQPISEPIAEPISQAQPKSDRAQLAVAIAALATLVLGCWRIFAATPERFVTSITNDDAYYFFQVARNIARGLGPSFDGLEFTNGVTPVWAAMLVPVFALVQDPDLAARSACALSLVLFVLALLLLRRVLAPLFGNWPTAAAVSAALLSTPMREVAGMGMDYSCNLLLEVLILASFIRLRSQPRFGTTWRLIAVGILVGLNCIQRPDTSLLPVLLTIPVLFADSNRRLVPTRDGMRNAALLVAGSLLVAIPALIGSQIVFGSPLTVSGKIKTHNALAQLEQGEWQKVGEALKHSTAGAPVEPTIALLGGSAFGAGSLPRSSRHFLLATLCALALWEALLRKRSRRLDSTASTPSPLTAIHGHALLHILVISCFLFPYIHYGNWYTAPEALGGIALSAGALALLARALPVQFGRTVAIGLGSLLLIGAGRHEYEQWTRPPVSATGLEAVSLPVAQYLHDELPPPIRIGVFNAGRIGYYADVHVVNLDGLINTIQFAEDVWISDRDSFSVRFLRYVLEKDIEWFVDSWVDDSPMLIVSQYFNPGVRSYFELVKSWPTETTYAVDRPGSYQLVHLDLVQIRRAIERAGN